MLSAKESLTLHWDPSQMGSTFSRVWTFGLFSTQVSLAHFKTTLDKLQPFEFRAEQESSLVNLPWSRTQKKKKNTPGDKDLSARPHVVNISTGVELHRATSEGRGISFKRHHIELYCTLQTVTLSAATQRPPWKKPLWLLFKGEKNKKWGVWHLISPNVTLKSCGYTTKKAKCLQQRRQRKRDTPQWFWCRNIVVMASGIKQGGKGVGSFRDSICFAVEEMQKDTSWGRGFILQGQPVLLTHKRPCCGVLISCFHQWLFVIDQHHSGSTAAMWFDNISRTMGHLPNMVFGIDL